MIGIIEELIESQKKATRECSYTKAIKELPEQDQIDLNNALKEDFQTTSILRVLKNRKIEVSYTAISRHRRRECICEH
jgi:hypothetical protein